MLTYTVALPVLPAVISLCPAIRDVHPAVACWRIVGKLEGHDEIGVRLDEIHGMSNTRKLEKCNAKACDKGISVCRSRQNQADTKRSYQIPCPDESGCPGAREAQVRGGQSSARGMANQQSFSTPGIICAQELRTSLSSIEGAMPSTITVSEGSPGESLLPPYE